MSRTKHLPDRTNWVVARDPETGKPATVTQKAFDGVYREKGFEIIDRDNVDDDEPRRTHGRRNNQGEGDAAGSGQQTGSAAEIADKLNLGAGSNEKQSDNQGKATESRKSTGRDRGGR